MTSSESKWKTIPAAERVVDGVHQHGINILPCSHFWDRLCPQRDGQWTNARGQVHGDSLYFLLNFSVNLKALYKKKNLLIKQTRHEKGGGEEGLTLFLESSPPAFPPLFYLSLFFLTQLVWISSCPPFPSSSHPPASILPRSFSDSAPKTSGTMRSVRYGEKGFFPV